MATKVTVLGAQSDNNIEFTDILICDMERSKTSDEPSEWQNVVLLRKNYGTTQKDLFFAYNDNNQHKGVLYLGHFNSGTV